MDRDQLIIALLVAMAVVLTIQLIYIFIKKKRRKEEMSLFKNRDKYEEPLADKAHNTVLTTESISQTLARQGADTAEAEGLIAEARREIARKDYARAIERAEAAKISLLRAKREMGANGPAAAEQQVDEDEEVAPVQQEKKQDSMPANFMQAKFMLATTKDLLESKGITAGEAHDLYRKGTALFDSEDYTGALSCAIRANKLLDSETVTLIGQDKPPESAGEVIEAMVCPGCEAAISEEDAFCRECGHNLTAPPECPGCGREVALSDKFCRKCGAKLQ